MQRGRYFQEIKALVKNCSCNFFSPLKIDWEKKHYFSWVFLFCFVFFSPGAIKTKQTLKNQLSTVLSTDQRCEETNSEMFAGAAGREEELVGSLVVAVFAPFHPHSVLGLPLWSWCRIFPFGCSKSGMPHTSQSRNVSSPPWPCPAAATARVEEESQSASKPRGHEFSMEKAGIEIILPYSTVDLFCITYAVSFLMC